MCMYVDGQADGQVTQNTDGYPGSATQSDRLPLPPTQPRPRFVLDLGVVV